MQDTVTARADLSLVDQLEIVRIDASPPGRPVLVFLHEGLGSVALWRDFPAALAKRANCNAVVYSRRGNGFSPPLDAPRGPSYMHDEACHVLPHLLAELQIANPILVGHSDGASIALIYAGVQPEAVRGLVLLAPHVFVEEISLASIAAVRQEYETTDLRERMRRYHADSERTFYGWNDVWLSPAFRDWNIEGYVAQIRAPALVIQGLGDQYGTLAQIDSLAAKMPRTIDRLLLERCGHAPHLERPSMVEATAAAWLAEIVESTRVT